MKRDWVQTVTAVLCAVLLAVTLRQGRETADLRTRLEESRLAEEAAVRRLDALDSAIEALGNIPDQPSFQFQNSSVDTENRMLTLDMAAEFPGEEEYNVSIGFCRVGEPYSLAWEHGNLHREEDGRFYGTATLFLDLDMGLEVRTEDDIVLYSSETVMPLLPLQMKYGGASIHHNSTAGIFSLCDLRPALTDLAGEPVRGVDGLYMLYRNGELAATVHETQSGLMENGMPEYMEVPCGQGDRIRLAYTCADKAGLRYEFQLGEWRAAKWDGAENCPMPPRAAAAWPE